MNRDQHMEWAKNRALTILNDRYEKWVPKDFAMSSTSLTESGRNAWASMCSDLNKHDGTREHPTIMLGMMLLMTGNWKTDQDVYKFIEGFR